MNFKYYDSQNRIGFTQEMIYDEDIYNSLDKSSKKRFTTFVKFIKSKNKNDDFSNVIYFTNDKKVKINCLYHGEYEISPNSYMQNHRCDKCSRNIISDKEFKNKIYEKFNNIEVLDKYVNMNTMLKIKCKNCGNVKNVRPSKLLEYKYGCSCLAKNIKITDEEYKLRLKNTNIECLDVYKNNNTKLTHKCKICNYTWKRIPILSNQLNDFSCPNCSRMKDSLLRRLNVDDLNKILMNENKNFICIKRDVLDKPLFKCNVCNHEWKHDLKHRYLYDGVCPNCNLTKGESKIRDVLQKYDITYITQYIFKDCKYKNSLRFDFYLPQNNTCIEYDGEQHFRYVNFNGSFTEKELEEQLEINRKRDIVKNDYCNKNNINLIRISYKDYDDIENILIDKLDVNKY